MAIPKPDATPKAYSANMPIIGGWHGSGSDNPRRARVSVGIELISAGIGSAGIDGSVFMVFGGGDYWSQTAERFTPHFHFFAKSFACFAVANVEVGILSPL